MGKPAGKDAAKNARTAANRERRIAKDAARKAWCSEARRLGHWRSISSAVRMIRRGRAEAN